MQTDFVSDDGRLISLERLDAFTKVRKSEFAFGYKAALAEFARDDAALSLMNDGFGVAVDTIAVDTIEVVYGSMEWAILETMKGRVVERDPDYDCCTTCGFTARDPVQVVAHGVDARWVLRDRV